MPMNRDRKNAPPSDAAKKDTKNKKKGKVKFTKIAVYILLSLVVIIAISFLSAFIYAERTVDLSADEALFSAARGEKVSALYHASDTEESGYLVEYLPGGEKVMWVDGDQVSPSIKNAFLAIEDRRFYSHKGIDWRRTAKAFLNVIFRFDASFGASTITQQTVKNLTGDRDRSALRKLREIYRALKMEERHEKDEIFELYLNIIPFTDGLIGVESASLAYFGKSASELSAAEAASIAAVTNAPATYDPRKKPEKHLERRDLVLSVMHDCGYLSSMEYESALGTPLSLVPQKETPPASWYAETVITDVTNALKEEKGFTKEAATRLLYSGGLRIYTCMDPRLQATLEGYFADASHFPLSETQVYAMTVLDPYTGDLLATVGSEGKKTGSRLLNYASDVRRPPGSALKPLSLFAPALESGGVTWSTVFDDVPSEFTEQGNGAYRMWPQNANRVYQGLVSFADAVAESKNTVAVQLYDRLGKERIYRSLTEDFGLSGILRRGVDANGNVLSDLSAAPLALGQLTYGVTLRELTAAYTAFADGGYAHRARSYTRVLDKENRVLLDKPRESREVMSAGNAAIMTQLLSGVVKHGTAASLTLDDFVELAGKTGTSSGGEDRYFIGYTPYLLAGIYCGASDREHVAPGSFKGHLTVYDEVMRLLHSVRLSGRAPKRQFRLPYNVVEASYCRDSGALLSDACALDLRGSREGVGYFLRGTEPHRTCTRHIPFWYDTKGEGLAHTGCLFHGEGATEEDFKRISLIQASDRAFPCEVTITDAGYVCRPIGDAPLSRLAGTPFFQNAVPNGVFVGRSPGTASAPNALCMDLLPEGEELRLLTDGDLLSLPKAEPMPELPESLLPPERTWLPPFFQKRFRVG